MDNAKTAPQNTLIEKTPMLLIRYEATGVLFERALSGEQITRENVGQIGHILETLAISEDDAFEFDLFDEDEEEFPEEAAEAEKSYWDFMVEQAAKELDEDHEATKEFEEGDIVEIKANAEDFEVFKDYYGEVVRIEDDDVLVEWLGWNEGHSGGIDKASTSYWWMNFKDLEKA